ncbi:sodium/proton antiporter (CPA1 family) [Branchiibius hedensis]|uniref:Sodium/proton antiporter, CPA1 family n=1 Tax=Branchiibius hedensis TaxID=672460 RepID=A0A2Y8ZX95_9MICO|nr:Na+/H+ antiporter [Branchiibius hedensis]PWJ26077.1 sodium/proton antiporter (CPA1 family) [Branchiibius hedensis]SSA34889.1 sodium/proton antiporter, CPA1 family [Branchiibius hedensis]
MHIAVPLLLLLTGAVAIGTLAERFRVSAPLVLVAVGAALSFVPGMPRIEIEPEFILLGLLPPLLFAAASQTSLVDLRRDRRQILSLSVLLVLVTAFGVSLIAWWLMGIPYAAALALGAIVAPPDAVAATAVARRMGLPRRVVAVLEGESLFNDATALVTVNTAKSILVSGSVTVLAVTGQLALAVVGGIAVGLLAYLILAWIRRQVTDTTVSVAISYLTPWLAYLPAEAIHASGVFAVVICGVLLAHQAPSIQTAASRVSERLNWQSLQYVLESVVFLLIGLEVRTIVEDVRLSTVGVAVLVLLTVMVLRPLYVMTVGFLTWRLRPDDPDNLRPREAAVVSWAGMRGVVTLAAAFLLPEQTPQREALIFIALFVTIGTLIIHGFTLSAVARALHLHGPDPREDALQLAQIIQAATQAGDQRLEQELDDRVPENVVEALRRQNENRANLAWEQLGRPDHETDTPTEEYRRLRLSMLDAERAKVLKMRDNALADHALLATVLEQLDIEESMIGYVHGTQDDLRDRILLTPEPRRGACDHLREAPVAVDPLTPQGCPDCEREGTQPVHLRLCLTCGNVGCCDSSIGQHATRHFHDSGHPVMRSFEPGEGWMWCYVDRLPG